MPVIRSDYKTYTLGTGLSATGSGVSIPGGEYHFMVDGTPAGATVALQALMPNGTWTSISVYSGSVVQSTTLPYSQTAVELPACQVRVALTGGSPTGINAYLVGMG